MWIDPTRIIPLHEVRRNHHFHELVSRMRRHGWQGRPLVAESLGEGAKAQLRPSGHFMGWTGTHRLAAARACSIKVPVILINGGRPSRRPLASKTTTDPSRYKFLRSRRDPAAILLRAELLINKAADERGLL